MVFPAEALRQAALNMSAYKEAMAQVLANASFSTEQVIQALRNMRIPSSIPKEETDEESKTDQSQSEKRRVNENQPNGT